MKKIFITALLAFIGFTGYSQTYTKIVVKGDTCLKVVQTKTTTDTLKRKELKEEKQKLIQAKKSNLESIDILKELNKKHDARLVELNALLLKTD